MLLMPGAMMSPFIAATPVHLRPFAVAFATINTTPPRPTPSAYAPR